MRKLLQLAAVTVLVGVVYAEVRKGPSDVRFVGKSLGFIPYDLRLPTMARIRQAYWDPGDPRVFTGTVAGIGWSVNFAALAEKIRRL